MRGTGSRPGGCWQFGRPGRGLPRQPGEEGLVARSRCQPWTPRCRTTWSNASERSPTSRSCCGRKSPAWRASDGSLRSVCWRNTETGAETTRPIRHLFLLVGADPNTDWLAGCDVALDAKGFVRTGIGDDRHYLETNSPGVFAIGDVRSGSVKRVASSVGEGAQVVAAIHEFIAKSRTGTDNGQGGRPDAFRMQTRGADQRT